MLKLKNIFNKKNTYIDLKNVLYNCNLNKIVQQTHICSIDVSYQGKTYKWKIKKNKINLIFNRANKTNLFLKKKLLNIKISKTKSRLFFFNVSLHRSILKIMQRVRQLNVFTLRGIKIKNQNIYKKKGKTSSYKKMFNFWNIFLFVLSAFILIMFLFFKTPTICFFLSEINWIVFIANTFVLANNTNDARFLLIAFVFIFIAALEVVLYIANFTYKNNV